MPETMIQMTIGGQTILGADVPITQSNELWSEYILEDGNILRVKLAVGSIIRVADQLDTEGNPVYIVKGSVVSVPIIPDKRQKSD